MKKTISIFLVFTIVLVMFSMNFSVYAEQAEEIALTGFIENTCEVIKEYDENKQLEVNDNNQNEKISESLNFQTCRLIVRADGKFDDEDANEHIKGFEDYHILQYANENQTENAYYQLQNEKNVISVNVDAVVSPTQGDEIIDTSTDIFPDTKNGHLCDWSTEQTQTAQVNDYILKNNIDVSEVTVGIIDQGVDYNHDFLQGRIKRTYFNSSATGNGIENDELDLLDGHGTATSSIVIDNTNDNVKIAMYRVLDDTGENTISGVCAGILKAVNDEVDVINISLCFQDENDLTKSAVEFADEKGIPVICAAGNEGYDIEFQNLCPAIFDKTITVSASDKNNRFCRWSNNGLNVDFAAPGETINVAVSNNRYDVWDGTSFAAPLVSAIYATILSIHPDWPIKRVTDTLKKTAVSAETYDEKEKCPVEEISFFGTGIVQLGNALGLTSINAPVINKQSGNYIDSVTVELQSEDDIYYTLDGSFPSKTNGYLYSSPVTITKDANLRAVSFNENNNLLYSREASEYYYIFEQGKDDMFTINEFGCITSYHGNVKNLAVPNKINGVTVTTFESEVFNESYLEGLILPDTIESIPEQAFIKNEKLKYINTGGAKTVKQSSFSQCRNLFYVDLPEVKVIDVYAFKNALSYGDNGGRGFTVNAPKVEVINRYAFYYADVISVFCPELTTLYNAVFDHAKITGIKMPKLTNMQVISIGNAYPFKECFGLKYIEAPLLTDTKAPLAKGCDQLQYINAPYCEQNAINKAAGSYLVSDYVFVNLKEINTGTFDFATKESKSIICNSLTNIPIDTFGDYPVNRLELSNVITAEDLPQNSCKILALSSAFEGCSENTEGNDYIVYGTKGSYAEKWAKDSGHRFLEISQDNAIVENVYKEYYGWGELSFDVIGFNKLYKWYGCYTPEGKDGVELCNGIFGSFSPLNYRSYPYYYAVCVSTDGDNKVEIKSDICQNIDYVSADYSEYNKAVERANAIDRSLYIDLTALDNALAMDVSYRNITEQNVVDKQTVTILAAIDNLDYKSADYSKVDEAIKSIPLDLSSYTDDSVKMLNDVVNSIDRTKNISEQDTVDYYVVLIENAVKALEKKQSTPAPSTTKPTDFEPTTEKNEISIPSTYEQATQQTDNPNIPKTGKTVSNKLLYTAMLSFIIFSVLKRRRCLDE